MAGVGPAALRHLLGGVMQQSQQWSFRQTWTRGVEFGVPGDVTARACAKTGGKRSRHPRVARALFDDKASSRVTLRAGGLVSLGAGALGERSGALGERRVCAVCGARRAAWCVRGVVRQLSCGVSALGRRPLRASWLCGLGGS